MKCWKVVRNIINEDTRGVLAAVAVSDDMVNKGGGASAAAGNFRNYLEEVMLKNGVNIGLGSVVGAIFEKVNI